MKGIIALMMRAPGIVATRRSICNQGIKDNRFEGPRGGRIVSVALIFEIGFDTNGLRTVLGMEIGTSEAEPISTEFLRKLTRRGLRSVKLVVSDAHEGLKAAVNKVLSAAWQHYRLGRLKKSRAAPDRAPVPQR